MKQSSKKKKGTNLFVRELTLSDAHSYSRISTGSYLHKYANFFEAYSLEEAQNRIRRSTNNYERLYGLFTKSNRLVAVFDVSDGMDGDATVHYFVGERYYGKGYAAIGIQKLSALLSDKYSHFHFEVDKDNTYSTNVQKQIGAQECEISKNFVTFVYSF